MKTRPAHVEVLETRIAPAGVFAWKNVTGNWNVAANWTPVSGDTSGGFPNAVDDEAQFLSPGAANLVVTIPTGVDITVGTLTIDDNNSYTIQAAGTGDLIIDTTAFAGGAINVTSANGSGAHIISVPIVLHDSLTISVSGAATATLIGVISGDTGYHNIQKTGSGLAEIGGSGSNTFNGNIGVQGGTLRLAKTGGATVASFGLYIGDFVNQTTTIARFMADDQLSSNATIQVGTNATLDLNNFSQTAGDLDLVGGPATITTGTGTLTTGQIFSRLSLSSGASISGFLQLTNNATINVDDGNATTDLTIAAVIKGTDGLTKTGAGTLELTATAAQQYTGTTAVNAGTLLLSTTTSDAGLSNTITIASGATLRTTVSYEIPDSATVTLDGGRLELGAADDFTVLAFTKGGTVSIETSLNIRAGGSVQVTGGNVPGAHVVGPGFFSLTPNPTTFFVGDTLDAADLTIDTPMTNAGITWSGTGKLVLNGKASLPSGVTVQHGVVEVDGTLTGAAKIDGGTLTGFGKINGITAGAFPGGRLEVGPFSVTSTGNVALSNTVTFSSMDYARLTVTGTVNITGVPFEHLTTQLPFTANPIVVIDNDGNDAIVGNFANLTEGAKLTTPTGNYFISYVGGDGNDVTLTPEIVAPTIATGGKSATYIDRDGDLVTVKITAGKLSAANFVLVGAGPGAQLVELLLNDPMFTGSNVTFTAAPKNGLGDKHVNAGYLVSNVDLGAISLPGDLSGFSFGNAATPAPAFKTLTVDSLGRTREDAFGGGTDIAGINETFGAIKVKGDVAGLRVEINTGAATAGSIFVGGSINPAANGTGGAFVITGALGSFTVLGDIVGGNSALTPTGGLSVTKTLGKLSVGGSLRGGAGDNSASIVVGGALGPVTIGRDLAGGAGANSGAILGGDAIGITKIGGSIVGGAGASSGFINGANIKMLTIAGDLHGGSGLGSGSVAVAGTLGPVKIGGSLLGGNAKAGLLATRIGAIGIKHDLRGESGSRALISATGVASPADAKAALVIASLTVGGSVFDADVIAGYNGSVSSPAFADVQIGPIKTKGSWTASRALAGVDPTDALFGNADDKAIAGGSANIPARIASIIIGGAVQGTAGSGDSFGFVAQQLGALTIGGAKIALQPIGGALDVITLGTFGDTFAREIAGT